VKGRDELGLVRVVITARKDQEDRDAVVAVLTNWCAQHHRPPTQQEWDDTPDVPFSARTVRRRWGWKTVLRQVLEGREPHAGQPGLGWSDHQMLLALLAAYRRDGVWPTWTSWAQATTEHPSSRTYARRFGSWRAAIATTTASSWHAPRLDGR
jgi:hypothetical protein